MAEQMGEVQSLSPDLAPRDLVAPGLAELQAEEASMGRPQETREEMLQRHRKESKDLQAKDMALKKAAAKGSKAEQKAKKKAADEEISKLEAKLKARHAKDLAGLGYVAEEPSTSGSTKGKIKQEISTLVDAVAGVKVGVVGAIEGKLSKGQKRRDKRMQQDAEREQRIQGEKEGLVSDRMVEEQQLRAKLRSLGLTLKEMKPDGHCMYRAVEDQLSLTGVNLDYLAVRSTAARYMREHSDDFLPFVISEHGEEEGPGTESDPAARLAKYCQEVESTSAWGGQLELEALAQALHRHIVVISADAPDVHMGVQEGGQDVPPIRVSYHKHEYGLGEHYNSIVPADDSVKS